MVFLCPDFVILSIWFAIELHFQAAFFSIHVKESITRLEQVNLDYFLLSLQKINYFFMIILSTTT